MFSVNFFLREPNSSSETPIHVFVSSNGFRKKMSSGIKIHPDLWDAENQCPTNNIRIIKRHDAASIDTLNQQLVATNTGLRRIRNIIDHYFLELSLTNSAFSEKELKSKIRGEHSIGAVAEKKTSLILDYLNTFIHDIETKKRRQNNGALYTEGSIKNYKNLRTTLIRYEKDCRTKIEWSSINREWYNHFINWHELHDMSTNYTGKHIKDLKCLMANAHDEQINENTCFRSRWFVIPQEDAIKHPLTEDEVDRLFQLPLPEGSTRCKARDMFLIGCFSGLRVSDILRLKPEHFENMESGRTCLKIAAKKTNRDVWVPVKRELHEIMQRYDYRCPKICEQTVNRTIKKIAAECGIDKIKCDNLSMHIGRHTFVTIAYFNHRIPMVDLMLITGHKTERNFRRYVNINPVESAKRMETYNWFR